MTLWVIFINSSGENMFSPDEGSCYNFSTRNNCCEFLLSYWCYFQRDFQPNRWMIDPNKIPGVSQKFFKK